MYIMYNVLYTSLINIHDLSDENVHYTHTMYNLHRRMYDVGTCLQTIEKASAHLADKLFNNIPHSCEFQKYVYIF